MKLFIFGIIAITLSLGFVEKTERESIEIKTPAISISHNTEVAGLEITKLNSFINTKNNTPYTIIIQD